VKSLKPLATSSLLSEPHLLSTTELATLDRFTLERRARALVSPVYLGDSRALCRLLGRYKFYVDTSDEGFGAHILLDGFWEGWVTTFLARQLRPGMRFVDVGANFGYYTLLGADLVGPSGRVAAIEPNPRAHGLLTMSVRLNGFAGMVETYSGALSDSTGETLLVVPASEPKNAYIPRIAEGAPELDAVSVPMTTGDALLAKWDRVDVLKIDAEGSEEGILRGLAGIVARDRPQILVEFHPARCMDPTEFLSAISKHYPTIRTLETDGQLHPVDTDTLLHSGRRDDWMIYLASVT